MSERRGGGKEMREARRPGGLGASFPIKEAIATACTLPIKYLHEVWLSLLQLNTSFFRFYTVPSSIIHHARCVHKHVARVVGHRSKAIRGGLRRREVPPKLEAQILSVSVCLLDVGP